MTRSARNAVIDDLQMSPTLRRAVRIANYAAHAIDDASLRPIAFALVLRHVLAAQEATGKRRKP